MTIERAAATADDSLSETTLTPINGLSLTPPSGTYQLFATIQLNIVVGGSVNTNFRVTVGGTDVPASIRYMDQDTSVDLNTTTIMINAVVSPNGSQVVAIESIANVSSTPYVAQEREMNLFPHPAGTAYNQTATALDTTSSATWATLDSMEVTPADSWYLLTFSTSFEGPATCELGLRVTVGGTLVDHTVRRNEQESSSADDRLVIGIVALVRPNGSQAVVVQFSRLSGTGAADVYDRSMQLMPSANADIFQEGGTADDSDNTTTDKQVDDMLLTDPGADTYMVAYTSSDFYGTIGNNNAEGIYSIRENGTKVTDSDRMQEHEGSLDGVNMSVHAGGRVVVSSGTSDLQIFWRNDSTDLRTARERTLLAIREPSAVDQDIAAVLTTVTSLTAALTAQGKLDTALALAMSVAADLKGAGELRAANALVLSVLADLDALGQLDAAMQLALSVAADLTAQGKLEVAHSITLSLAADIKSIPKDLAAAPSLTVAITAALTAEGKLDTAMQLALSVAAVLSAEGKLEAAASLVLAIAADLKGAGELRAAAALTLSVAADVKALGRLDAALATSLIAAANLTGAGKVEAAMYLILTLSANVLAASAIDLLASLPIGVSVSADIDALGTLAAAPALVISAAADLEAQGKIEAATNLLVTLAADLKGAGVLRAALGLTTAMAADIRGLGELRATPLITLTMAANITEAGVVPPSAAVFRDVWQAL